MTMTKMLKFFGQAWLVVTLVMVIMSVNAFAFPADTSFMDKARLYLSSEAFLKALAEGFYYAALGLGIYAIYNRRRERREAEDAKAAEDATIAKADAEAGEAGEEEKA